MTRNTQPNPISQLSFVFVRFISPMKPPVAYPATRTFLWPTQVPRNPRMESSVTYPISPPKVRVFPRTSQSNFFQRLWGVFVSKRVFISEGMKAKFFPVFFRHLLSFPKTNLTKMRSANSGTPLLRRVETFSRTVFSPAELKSRRSNVDSFFANTAQFFHVFMVT